MFPSDRVRVLISTQPVDFRKGHDGLTVMFIASQIADVGEVGQCIQTSPNSRLGRKRWFLEGSTRSLTPAYSPKSDRSGCVRLKVL